MERDRVEMSQRERDVLKIMDGVLKGGRSQAEAARLLRLSVRQVGRLKKRLLEEGDRTVVHGLRGQPSNRRKAEEFRKEVLENYRQYFADFGPTLAAEKLAEMELPVLAETLRRWLLAEGLWQRQRRRDKHRSRRPPRACFGELVQMDASIHDWTEGRGEPMVLVAMIDDATKRVEAGFYEGETLEAYFDLMEHWIRKRGRPVEVYTDRNRIFESNSEEGQTQFERAMSELNIKATLAYSPQAKGRIERFFGTAQDRWVKEMRLAGVRDRAEANRLVRSKLLPHYNRRFTVKPSEASDAHRPREKRQDLAAILCPHFERVVANDYVVRFCNRFYQIRKPALPGLRGGEVIIEQRRNGKLMIRFGDNYLRFDEIEERKKPSSAAKAGVAATEAQSPYRPAAHHPWRKGFSKRRRRSRPLANF